MNNVFLICDLQTCRSMAKGQLAAWTGGETLFWLPEPIYHQLTKSEKSRMEPLLSARIVRKIRYPKGFLERYATLPRTGLSMADSFMAGLFFMRKAHLMCSADWYLTVQSYVGLPAFERKTTHEETLWMNPAAVSDSLSTTGFTEPVLLIMNHAIKHLAMKTK